MSSRASGSQVSSEGGVSEPVCEANQKDGGYDFETVEEVPTKLVCPICKKILREPHLTGCCGQHFCATCLNKQEKQACPLCKEKSFNHMLDKSIRGEINELKIYCTNRKAGCEWSGKLSTLQDHVVSGSGCRLVCPNKCGKTTGVKPAEIDQHRSKCPLEPVECPFKEAGCQVKVVRKEFESHMANSQQQHLLTLMGAFQVAKMDLETVKVQKAGLEAMKVDLEATKEDLKAMKAELEAKEKVIAADVTILHQSSGKVESDLALASIESQLEMTSHRLQVNGSPLTIRMTNFSHYKQSGKVWYSPPFYYGDGYKMQLAVYANGTGAGAGTHVSIVLLRMKGEHDDQLRWTEDDDDYDVNVDIVKQIPTVALTDDSTPQKKKDGKNFVRFMPKHRSKRGRENGSEKGRDSFREVKLKHVSDVGGNFCQNVFQPRRLSGIEDVREEGKKERFCALKSMSRSILLNDTIVLQVSIISKYEHITYSMDSNSGRMTADYSP